jgi:hypothetical protein
MQSSPAPKFNNYWLLFLLCLCLFASRFYQYASSRLQSEDENLRQSFNFGTFLVYNYFLALILMLLFIGGFFLVFKALAYFWKGVQNGQLMQVLLLSYLVFFVPTVLKSIYFSVFKPQASSSERRAFSRMFYLEQESNFFELSDLWLRMLSGISYIDFVFFIVLFLLCSQRFETVRTSTLVFSILALALVYFGSGVIGVLMMA